ncbi:MAG: radical SAM family heme chaperone HemW [Acidaminococcaceae bacterium]
MKKKWEQIQGIYIHIPFCMQKCLYCDFASFAGKSGLMHQYALALADEIRRRAGEMSISERATVFFGGGTPSLLPIDDLKMVINTLKETALWREPAEVTMEMNPGTVDFAKLCQYREAGIDRISFGVQTLSDNELKIIGRLHTANEALQAIELASKAGFERISADLIYGLPSQTLVTFKDTLATIVDSAISHLSVYGLTVEEETPLAAMLAKGSFTLPSEEEAEMMYDHNIRYLEEHGLYRYEISNFARAGQESLHNLVYWHYLPYYGFGSSACSYNGKQRMTNAVDIESYIKGTTPNIEQLPARTSLAEFMFLGLRTNEGINLSIAKERFNVDVMSMFEQKIEKYINKEMLSFDPAANNLKLTKLGMKFGNEIFELFL